MVKELSVFVMMVAVLLVAQAWADTPVLPEVPGIIGMTPVEEGSCMAVYVPMEPGYALSGVMWYNNDETVVFPEVLVASGVAGIPESAATALLVAAEVSGASLDWSRLDFSEPVVALDDGLYVVFRLPTGSEHVADGYAGGAGIGYTVGANGYTGWISPDGIDWIKLQAAYGMAVQPLLVEAEDGMAGKAMEEPEAPPVTHTALLLPSPNPFNPQTELHYQLKEAGAVDLSVYNVRGERLVRLASGHHASGRYSVAWQGTDSAGQRLASGAYFARFHCGTVVQTQRLTLLK